jgi:hypothetical protein
VPPLASDKLPIRNRRNQVSATGENIWTILAVTRWRAARSTILPTLDGS